MTDIQKTSEEIQEEFVTSAMHVILAAGDARHAADASFEALLSGDMKKADELMKEADKNILEAHHRQTSIIQTEAAIEMRTGRPSAVPLLFIHAQDTVMTIMSEVRLYKAMSKMYKQLKS